MSPKQQQALFVPSTIATWEAVATVVLAQAKNLSLITDSVNLKVLADYAEVSVHSPGSSATPIAVLHYDKAYRNSETYLSYFAELITSSGVDEWRDLSKWELKPPRLQIPPSESNVVLCPFGLTKDVGFQVPTGWQHIIQFLQTYDRNLTVLGEPGERLDDGRFMESHIADVWPFYAKLLILASASLVVGPPNAWTWLSTAWGKKAVILYPDSIPQYRWFPDFMEHDQLRRIHYPQDLQLPVILAGLRKVINQL